MSQFTEELDGLVHRMTEREVRLLLSIDNHKGFLAAQVFYALLQEVKEWKLELEKITEGYKHESV